MSGADLHRTEHPVVIAMKWPVKPYGHIEAHCPRALFPKKGNDRRANNTIARLRVVVSAITLPTAYTSRPMTRVISRIQRVTRWAKDTFRHIW